MTDVPALSGLGYSLTDLTSRNWSCWWGDRQLRAQSNKSQSLLSSAAGPLQTHCVPRLGTRGTNQSSVLARLGTNQRTVFTTQCCQSRLQTTRQFPPQLMSATLPLSLSLPSRDWKLFNTRTFRYWLLTRSKNIVFNAGTICSWNLPLIKSVYVLQGFKSDLSYRDHVNQLI